MEHDGGETTGVTRGQNVLHLMPHDWASIAHFLAPAVERLDPERAELQMLVITADAETAAAVIAAAVRVMGDRPLTAVAATSDRRATRLLQLRPSQIVAGPATTLLSLVKSSTIKLEGLRAICLAWVDELFTAEDAAALETLMGEVPKEAARIIVATTATPEIDGLVERYARRARRVVASMSGGSQVKIEYVTGTPTARPATLRRVLDETDPATAVVFARPGAGEAEAREAVRALGFIHADSPVRVATSAGMGDELVVLYDLPASREELLEAVGEAPKRVVALVQPRQLSSLRLLAGGGSVMPLTLPDAPARARKGDERLRADLRDVLQRGTFGRELLALEPLLEEYDGIEVAAAAVSLLEQARTATADAVAAASARAASGAPAAASGPTGDTKRVFLSVGSMDNVRPNDLVGAILNEAGIPKDALGRVEIRDNHSLVDIAADSADTVVSKMTGVTIKGRRIVAKIDDRPARPSFSDRGGRSDRGDRGDRGPRAPRGDRPPRAFGGASRERSDRAPRSDRGAPRSDRGERGARGERPDRSRGDRPARPPRRPRDE